MEAFWSWGGVSEVSLGIPGQLQTPNWRKIYEVSVAVAVLDQSYRNLGKSLYFLIIHTLWK